MYPIVKVRKLADKIFYMDVKAPRVAKSCLPGQFVIVKVDEKGERIPLTICDYSREDETVTIVFQTVGTSTEMMAELKEGDSFADGMKMIYKQLITTIDELGVKPIEAVGKEFDPNFHNAVMQVESEEYDSGVVAQELQKGYMYKDSVVRHSMVAVVS